MSAESIIASVKKAHSELDQDANILTCDELKDIWNAVNALDEEVRGLAITKECPWLDGPLGVIV